MGSTGCWDITLLGVDGKMKCFGMAFLRKHLFSFLNLMQSLSLYVDILSFALRSTVLNPNNKLRQLDIKLSINLRTI